MFFIGLSTMLSHVWACFKCMFWALNAIFIVIFNNKIKFFTIDHVRYKKKDTCRFIYNILNIFANLSHGHKSALSVENDYIRIESQLLRYNFNL